MIFFRCYLILLLLSFTACGPTEFSPNQKFDGDTPTDLNARNIARLQAQPKDDTIRFVLTGDTQRAYSESKDLVKKINTLRGVDFLFIAGDISDFGLYQEMEWVNDIYSKLNIPYIGVLGNHDIAANGKEVFRRMYGNENFSFIYDGIKFICHDTNSREYGFDGSIPDIPWLKKEMEAQGLDGYVAVSHVPPFSGDFDKQLEQEYVGSLLSNGKFLASLHGHDHQTRILFPYDKSTPFLVTNTVANREFFLIDIVNGKLSYELIKF